MNKYIAFLRSEAQQAEADGCPISADALREAANTIKQLDVDNTDLRLALRVHSGKASYGGMTKNQQKSLVRGLALCEVIDVKE